MPRAVPNPCLLLLAGLLLAPGAAFAEDAGMAPAPLHAAEMPAAEMHAAEMHSPDSHPAMPALSGNADLAFLQAMIPHHRAALDMAKAELQSGKDPFARDLATKIQSGQTAEIAYMQDLIDHHAFDQSRTDKDADTGETAPTLYAESMGSMHEAMPQPTGKADVDFVAGMVPHHEGAIDMAQIELDLGQDALVRELARRISDDQEAEIAQMQDWLASRQ